jgi:hypothetical protein
MPKGENSGGNGRLVRSPINKTAYDREDYGPTLAEVAEKLGISKEAVWEMERRAIRRLWRMGVPSNRDLHRDGEKQLTNRIEALKCSTSK